MSDNEAGARFSPQPNRSKTYCVVPKCCSKAKREITVRFHCFPKTSANDYVSIANRQGVLEMMTRREAWEQRLMLESHKVSKSSRVCSLHFRRNDYILPDAPTLKRYLKKDAVPTCNLPKPERWPVGLNYQRNENNILPQNLEAENPYGFTTIKSEFLEPEISLITPNTEMLFDNESISTKVSELPEKVSITADKDLHTLTGISKIEILNRIVECVKTTSPRLSRAVGLRLSIADRIIMSFMKLRRAISYEILAVTFKCTSRKSCKRIILKTLNVLSVALKPLINFPLRKPLNDKCVCEFSKVRCILNRIEIAIRKPKNESRRLATRSLRKKMHSLKLMIAVSTDGTVCFVSQAYDGGTSCGEIFERSNFLKLLEKDDGLMLLKDFPIDDVCRTKNIKILRSLYSANREEAMKDDSYRALVNFNRRIRKFEIFRRKLTRTLARRTERIIIALAGVQNLSYI